MRGGLLSFFSSSSDLSPTEEFSSSSLSSLLISDLFEECVAWPRPPGKPEARRRKSTNTPHNNFHGFTSVVYVLQVKKKLNCYSLLKLSDAPPGCEAWADCNKVLLAGRHAWSSWWLPACGAVQPGRKLAHINTHRCAVIVSSNKVPTHAVAFKSITSN